jgi:hypothetical protein
VWTSETAVYFVSVKCEPEFETSFSKVIFKSATSDEVEIELHPIFFKLWRHQPVKKPPNNAVGASSYADQQQSSMFSTYGLMAGYSPASMGKKLLCRS